MNRRKFIPLLASSALVCATATPSSAALVCATGPTALGCAAAFILRRLFFKKAARKAGELALKGTIGRTVTKQAISVTGQVMKSTVTRGELSVSLSSKALLAIPAFVLGVSPSVAETMKIYDAGELWLLGEKPEDFVIEVAPSLTVNAGQKIRAFIGCEIKSSITGQLLYQKLITVFCDQDKPVAVRIEAPILDHAGPVILNAVAYTDPWGNDVDARFIVESGHNVVIAHPSEIQLG